MLILAKRFIEGSDANEARTCAQAGPALTRFKTRHYYSNDNRTTDRARIRLTQVATS